MADRVISRGTFLNRARIAEQTTWPMADDKFDALAHTLRYGSPETVVAARLDVACVLDAYYSLVQNTQKMRTFYGGRIKRISNLPSP